MTFNLNQAGCHSECISMSEGSECGTLPNCWYCSFSVFKMAAVHRLRFCNVEIFNGHSGVEGQDIFVKIGQSVAEIWYHDFSIFGWPYYRSCLWYTVSSVCRLSVCLSVTFCIVAKRYVLAKNCLKEWIGNQGQKVDFLGRRHISTSGCGSMRRPFLPYFCPYSPAIGTRWYKWTF